MTALHLADAGEAADLGAFLSRLLHYDRGAAVRLQATGVAVAVFGRPPSFEVLAVRGARLAQPHGDGGGVTLDVTVSAGELLESLDEAGATAPVPAGVTGPPWVGVLPPRGGWRPEPGLPASESLRELVAEGVAEFRRRTGELDAEERSGPMPDAIGREIWSRPVGSTALPVRAVHAAQSLGFLGRGGETPRGAEGPVGPVLLAAGAWLRLRTSHGSVAVRRTGPGPSATV
ncbi:hypothetical protein AAH978_07035 [Streptomyces sp. ZYX-F-203]